MSMSDFSQVIHHSSGGGVRKEMITSIGMVAQLCFVELECTPKLDELSEISKAIASNSSRLNETATCSVYAEHNLNIEDYLFTTLCATCAVLGVVFNLLTIITLLTGRRNSREIRIQLVNLAISDLLWSLVGPAIFVYIRLEIPMTSNEALCKLISFLGFLVVTVSPLCNVAISLDRFVAVYFPMKIINYRTRHKVMAAAAVWMIGILVDMGTLFNAHTGEWDNQTWCYARPIIYDKTKTLPFEQFLIATAIKFGLPSIVMIVMYALIAGKLHKRHGVGDGNADIKDQLQKRVSRKL